MTPVFCCRIVVISQPSSERRSIRVSLKSSKLRDNRRNVWSPRPALQARAPRSPGHAHVRLSSQGQGQRKDGSLFEEETSTGSRRARDLDPVWRQAHSQGVAGKSEYKSRSKNCDRRSSKTLPRRHQSTEWPRRAACMSLLVFVYLYYSPVHKFANMSSGTARRARCEPPHAELSRGAAF